MQCRALQVYNQCTSASLIGMVCPISAISHRAKVPTVLQSLCGDVKEVVVGQLIDIQAAQDSIQEEVAAA